ncbi:MAG: M48 family metallopeptidase [Syntrophobacteraceae bacterium]
MKLFSKSLKIMLLILVPALAVIYGCAFTQAASGGSISDVLGGAAGGILPGKKGNVAEAVARGAVAMGKSFQDITPEQEYYIGRAVAANVLSAYPPGSNDGINLYLNLLGQTLAQASERPETFGGYHFLMLDSPEINAFAAPGGLILITRGMIRLCKTEDALAAVLAHEIAHIQGKHGLKAIKTSRLTSAFTVMAAEVGKSYTPAGISQITEAFEGSVTDITTSLMNNGYSRDLEREADQGAITILRRVGYDTGALPAMLGEMQKQVKPGGPGFGKTHPDPKERIADVRSLAGAPAARPASGARQKRFEAALKGM